MIRKDNATFNFNQPLWLGDPNYCVSAQEWDQMCKIGVTEPTIIHIRGHSIYCWPVTNKTHELYFKGQPFDFVPVDSEVLCLAPLAFVPKNAVDDGSLLDPQSGVVQTSPLFKWGDYHFTGNELE